MKASQYLSVLLASAAAAVPTTVDVSKRAAAINDLDILNFALTLEHLENAFYKEALTKFNLKDFEKAGFMGRTRTNVREISGDENTHVAFLTQAIRDMDATPVKACTYKFGLDSVETFFAISQVLEGVGVSAYLGAAALISDKEYLTPAGSILTVEARHNAYIRNHQTVEQSPFPSPFDVPLTPNEVFTLASPFIVKCPDSNPALPLMTFPALSVASGQKAIFQRGSSVVLDVAKKLNANKDYYAAFILVTGPQFVKTEVLKGGKQIRIAVPKSALFSGQAYAVLSTSNTAITDANTVAGPAIIPVA